MAGIVGSYARINGAGTTTVRTGSGVLHRITINTGAAGSVTVFDNTAGSGTTIATITVAAAAPPVTLDYDLQFNIGLTLVVVGAIELTVVHL